MRGVAIMPPSTETAALEPEGDETTVTKIVLGGSARFSFFDVVNAVVLEIVLIVDSVLVELVWVVVEFIVVLRGVAALIVEFGFNVELVVIED
jgi:hypothetical protein